MSIQSSVNSMINTVAGGVILAKKLSTPAKPAAPGATSQTGSAQQSIQKQAADRAKTSAASEIAAKREQRRNFMEYLKKQPTSFGGTVGDLPTAMQKQIASGYNKSQRKKLMDLADQEANNGKH